MKSIPQSAAKRNGAMRVILVVPFFISLLAALLGGWLLFGATLLNPLVSIIINVGLDPLRAQLIAALLMTMGTGLIGTALGRRKSGAVIGAGMSFWFNYLIGFIQLELQPLRDPGGNLEPLNSGALVHTAVIMGALTVLSAFIGAAVGLAVSEVFFDPPYRLARLIWQRWSAQRRESPTTPFDSTEGRRTLFSSIGSWLAIIFMLAMLVLASSSTDLFIFSPDVGLHIPPKITSKVGTIVEDSVVSPALKGQRKPFLVYLPPSYNTPEGRTKRYPTLYLLHGSPGKDLDWFKGGGAEQSADTLIATHKIPELILISPDGNGRPRQTSEWGNSGDQAQLMENYVAFDLVRYVDQKYRTVNSPAFRGIGGLSMGGFGAMNIAVHHPDIFGTVISLGGYYRVEGSIWGNNSAYRQENSPAVYLPTHAQSWKLHMYLGAATRDQPYYTYTKQFAQELARLHIPYQFDLQQGYHSWRVWQVQMYNALAWIRWG